MLASRLAGWARAGVLDAYETERLPITEQVSRFAMDHAQQMIKARGAVPPESRSRDPKATPSAPRTGRASYELNVQQFCCAGLNFGYFYDRSPLIAYDGEAQPAYSDGRLHGLDRAGLPGAAFLAAGGRSLYDAFGADYTLLRLDRPPTSRRSSTGEGARRAAACSTSAGARRPNTGTPSFCAAPTSTSPGAATGSPPR